MAYAPPENNQHVHDVAREVLEGWDDHPDIIPRNRWLVIRTTRVPSHMLNELGSELRPHGYEVSVVPAKNQVKVAAGGVEWPGVGD